MSQAVITRDNLVGQLWIAIGQGAGGRAFAADGVQQILNVYLRQVDAMVELWGTQSQTLLDLARTLGAEAARAAADDGSGEIHEAHVAAVTGDPLSKIVKVCPCS